MNEIVTERNQVCRKLCDIVLLQRDAEILMMHDQCSGLWNVTIIIRRGHSDFKHDVLVIHACEQVGELWSMIKELNLFMYIIMM